MVSLNVLCGGVEESMSHIIFECLVSSFSCSVAENSKNGFSFQGTPAMVNGIVLGL